MIAVLGILLIAAIFLIAQLWFTNTAFESRDIDDVLNQIERR